MPEIGEVARLVHYLRKHVAGKAIKSVRTQDDNIVYGKVGTSAAAFEKAMNGKTITGAGQQGKYFWLTMDSAPHPVMHLGMTGWIDISTAPTGSYRKKTVKEEWPPRFWKFILELDDEEKTEVAFTDSRRLGRIRLVDAAADELRRTTPLKENGPDPVVDKDIVTVEWLSEKVKKKKVPIKAFLLDQANLSGVGNWVADEVLYQARIHPEQYCNTFSDAQLKSLHDNLISVCTIACETLAETEKFPKDWIMLYRWSKGKKDQNVLPNGDKITFLTVGGRTSAIVPRVQKKTGPVAADVPEEEETVVANGTGSTKSKKRRKTEDVDDDESEANENEDVKAKAKRPSKAQKTGSRATPNEEPVKAKATPKKESAAKDSPRRSSRRKTT